MESARSPVHFSRAGRWLADTCRWLWRNTSRKRRLTIHLYALCWNEETMLPFFFRHYDGIADRYFVFDTGSTDRSLEILQSHPRVQLSTVRPEGDSFVHENTALQNQFWKQSRGKADWVIITAIDEHLYHPDLRGYLGRCRDEGITLIRAEGYEMISDEFPRADERLCQYVKRGMRSAQWLDKVQAFNPDKIDEINYVPGRHAAGPTGKVVTPEQSEVKLLHYKFLGRDYVLQRYLQLRTGLRPGDVENKLGEHYLWSPEDITARYEQIKSNSVQVI